MRKIINRALNIYSKYRLISKLPELEEKLRVYRENSKTTGTQWITLLFAVNDIFKYRPTNILESGTGSSTLVLAEAVRRIQKYDSTYQAKITSMESQKQWYQIAKDALPLEYSDIVQIVYGPRERFELSLFRGYAHQNIPDRPYDYFLLDGPSFEDDCGTSFCADVLFIAQQSFKKTLRGTIDGRTSSALCYKHYSA